MIETATFTCSICGESSNAICVYCTKDACANHRCDRCHRCSDCCECDVPLTAPLTGATHQMAEPGMSESAIAAWHLAEPDIPEPDTPEEHVPDAAAALVQETDSAWLTPPEASEEPDLNTPPTPVIEEAVEQQQQHEEKACPLPTNSARGVPEGAD